MPNNAPWDDHHHRSYLLDSIEDNLSDVHLPNIIESFTNSISIHEVNSKRNLLNIEETIPLDTFIKSDIIKNLHISASCSPSEIKTCKALFQEFRDVFSWTCEEMAGINPNLVVHDIKTYPYEKLF